MKKLPKSQEKTYRSIISKINKYYLAGNSYSEVIDPFSEIYNDLRIEYSKLKEEQKKKDKEKKDSKKAEIKNQFPSLKKLITLVYTRDEVVSRFGPWFEFDFFEPLKFLILADNLITKNELKFDKFKFAGFLFALHVYSTLDNDKPPVKIFRPNSFYFTADIVQSSVKDYFDFCRNLFGVEHKYTREEISSQTGEYSTKLEITGVENYRAKITDKFTKLGLDDLSSDNIKEDYFWHLSLYDSGLDLTKFENFINEPKLLENYELKHFRDKYSRFYHPGLKNNPFIRLFETENNYHIVSQLDLLNYKILFYSLYTDVSDKGTKIRLKGVNSFFDNRDYLSGLTKVNHQYFTGSVDALVAFLEEKSVHIEKKMITEIEHHPCHDKKIWDFRVNKPSKHFEQIKKVQKYIWDLNNTGIPVRRDYESIKDLTDNDEQTPAQVVEDILSEAEVDLADNFETLEGSLANEKRFLSVNDILQHINRHNRLTGYFKAHGAATHRMTCHKINLQGVPKYIRTRLYEASKDKVLVSSDVTGQDIVVAANLAKRVVKDPFFSTYDRIDDLKKEVDHTLKKLTIEPTNKPTRHLTNIIADRLNSIEYDQLSNFNDRDELKGYIKKCIYTKLYGGGERTFKNSMFSDKIKVWLFSIDSILFPLVNEEYISKEFSDISLEKASKKADFDDIHKRIRKLKENLPNTDDYRKPNELITFLDQYYKEQTELRSKSADFFTLVIDTMTEEYPGIIETLDILGTYSMESNLNLSYPSLLGWQTVLLEPGDSYQQVKQRAGSYPVQASGGELIRQWLIEVCKHTWYKKGYFSVVNVIHDQLLLEVNHDRAKRVSEKILPKALLRAAKEVGIDPKSIQTETQIL